MSDPQGDTPVKDRLGASSHSDEISRSIGAAWQRHVGHRPDGISTEIDGTVVRCEIEDASEDRPQGPTYRREAIATVARITGRRVMGFIPKHDTKLASGSETFILDGVRRRY